MHHTNNCYKFHGQLHAEKGLTALIKTILLIRYFKLFSKLRGATASSSSNYQRRWHTGRLYQNLFLQCKYSNGRADQCHVSGNGDVDLHQSILSA